MNKPNFDTMNEAELRSYVYEHREDQEAFYAFVDRLQAKPRGVVYPASMTPEEIQQVILERVQQLKKLPDTEATA
jgi:hypothetical protein